jgi:hypothetical protein
MLPPHRQCDHPLQHLAPLAGIRAKSRGGRSRSHQFLKGTSPAAWHNINLNGNFDFTTPSSPVDMEALAARYQNEDF